MRLPPLLPGILIKRYKRFLADIKLTNGHTITAHCPNSGSMITCAEPGWKVMISKADNPNRKLKYTWELVHNGKCWISVNTIRTNRVGREAIEKGRIPELSGYIDIRSEVKYGTNSRVDFLLSAPDKSDCYVEIKSVTLVREDGYYKFPDSVTSRGSKHLRELIKVKGKDKRAVMLYIIQRSDGTLFAPARNIDPEYAQGLIKAHKAGVEILVYGTRITRKSITLAGPIRIIL